MQTVIFPNKQIGFENVERRTLVIWIVNSLNDQYTTSQFRSVSMLT